MTLSPSNLCVFTGLIKEDTAVNLTHTGKGTARLFVPILTKRYIGQEDRKYAFTSVPLVWYAGFAERAANILRPGMTIAVTARFDSNYDKENDKEWVTFVVDSFDIVGWPKDGETPAASGDLEEDNDEFPF